MWLYTARASIIRWLTWPLVYLILRAKPGSDLIEPSSKSNQRSLMTSKRPLSCYQNCRPKSSFPRWQMNAKKTRWQIRIKSSALKIGRGNKNAFRQMRLMQVLSLILTALRDHWISCLHWLEPISLILPIYQSCIWLSNTCCSLKKRGRYDLILPRIIWSWRLGSPISNSRLLLPDEEGDEEELSGDELAARLAFRLKRLEAMRGAGGDSARRRSALQCDLPPWSA